MVRSTGKLGGALRVGVRVAVLAVVAAFGGATAGAAPDVCATAGVTTAVAVNAFGPRSLAKSVDVPVEPANCALYAQGGPATANVYLFPKSKEAAEKALDGSSGKTSTVSGLGSGAIFVNLLQVGKIEFTAGAYFVEVDGPPPLLPKLKTLAHAIYAKLG